MAEGKRLKAQIKMFQNIFFFPAAAVTPPVLLSPGEFILSSQPNVMELTSSLPFSFPDVP